MGEINTVTIPREEYNTLMTSQARLNDLHLIAARDECRYGHYENVTSDVIDLLLGIKRKEKAD